MGSQRIEYIDAMRGFTMLLVVYSHIQFFGYAGSFCNDISMGGNNFLSFNSLFISFRMPLFFFVSGFILFKKGFYWNRSASIEFIGRKAKVQLIPTLFFIMLMSFISNSSFVENCCTEHKIGYWFTVALFEYFVIYILYRNICNLLGRRQGIDWLLLVGGILLYFVSTPTCLKKLNVYETLYNHVLGLSYLRYFIFFALGTIVKKHFDKVIHYMDNGYLSALWILCFWGVSIAVLHNGYFENTLYTHLYLIANGVFGLMLVFMFFRKYQNAFSQERTIGRVLQFIGRRTLDIYLLHYFFIPHNLDSIGSFFSQKPNPSIEFVVSLLLVLIVVSICLIISSVIRISPVLSNYLLGVKK